MDIQKNITINLHLLLTHPEGIKGFLLMIHIPEIYFLQTLSKAVHNTVLYCNKWDNSQSLWPWDITVIMVLSNVVYHDKYNKQVKSWHKVVSPLQYDGECGDDDYFIVNETWFLFLLLLVIYKFYGRREGTITSHSPQHYSYQRGDRTLHCDYTLQSIGLCYNA